MMARDQDEYIPERWPIGFRLRDDILYISFGVPNEDDQVVCLPVIDLPVFMNTLLRFVAQRDIPGLIEDAQVLLVERQTT
jgi:hypothetical protein